MTGLKSCLAAAGLVAFWGPPARAQAVAFVPQVSSFPNGVTLGVTPAISADGRYVRMTLNPQFTVIEGFDTFSVPFAVSGVNPGGGLGGRIGLGGIAGLAGMNGPVNGGGVAVGAPFGAQAVGPGLPAAPNSGFGGSGDFEDQAWPDATGVNPPRALAPAVPKAVRRRGRATRVERPATARASTGGAKRP